MARDISDPNTFTRNGRPVHGSKPNPFASKMNDFYGLTGKSGGNTDMDKFWENSGMPQHLRDNIPSGSGSYTNWGGPAGSYHTDDQGMNSWGKENELQRNAESRFRYRGPGGTGSGQGSFTALGQVGQPPDIGKPVDPNNIKVSINSTGTGSGAYGGRGNPPVAPTKSGSSYGTGRGLGSSGGRPNPNATQTGRRPPDPRKDTGPGVTGTRPPDPKNKAQVITTRHNPIMEENKRETLEQKILVATTISK